MNMWTKGGWGTGVNDLSKFPRQQLYNKKISCYLTKENCKENMHCSKYLWSKVLSWSTNVKPAGDMNMELAS